MKNRKALPRTNQILETELQTFKKENVVGLLLNILMNLNLTVEWRTLQGPDFNNRPELYVIAPSLVSISLDILAY